MIQNKILDYEQVEQKLQKICENSNGKIEKKADLAITNYGLPIHYYTIGHGKKEMVITGATHGSEIITTDFILNLMEEMTKENGTFKNINLDEFTFHIIPMLNPEGYLISTSAIRTIIPRDMNLKDAEKICKKYYLAYRKDDQEAIQRIKEGLSSDKTTIKHHQKMFEHVDWTCIPLKYDKLRKKVKEIYEKYPDLPNGSMICWNANGDGIDIQSNCIYNKKIPKIQNNEHLYTDSLRYSNIDSSHPGPLNCPMDKDVGFYETIETQAISNLLQHLHEKGTLVGYENYHSTGGLIYQRPCKNGNGFEISQDLYWERIVNNIFKAMSYSEHTYKNSDDKSGSKYTILKNADLPNSTNDVFRMKYPANLLIELSAMGGNPIAPYGDIDGNYTSIMSSNIDAYKEFLQNYSIIEKLSKAAYNAFRYIMRKHNMEPVDSLKEKHIMSIYEISEIMMKEARKYIENGKIKELEELLTKGFFADEEPHSLVNTAKKYDAER